MRRPRFLFTLAATALLSLGGCVAYPVDGYYAQPAQVYSPPPSIYFGGSFGGYRPHYGNRHWGHRHGGHRHGGHRHWR